MTLTLLCMSSYFKGEEFMREAKRQGCHVILLTEEKLRDADWPRESIDELFLMPNLSRASDVTYAVSYLMRGKYINAIIPLDEYDVEMAALLREHLRIPGLNFSQTRFFRDKLAMRMKTHEAGINVPPFTPVLNYDVLRDYMSRVSPPWVLKPRLEAGAMGIKKVYNDEELWRWLDMLGDQQSFRVLEKYIPGDVFHVDSIIDGGEILFSSAQKYGAPPMDVAHGGGVFITRTLPNDTEETRALKEMNARVVQALGLEHGVTHAEFIKAHEDGQLYFLEIAARVGGAHIADLIHMALGINLWGEWARLEIAHLRGEKYQLPSVKDNFGGLMVCLAKQEWPDLSGYNDPEVVWRLHKQQHAGLIVASPEQSRVDAMVKGYQERFGYDFLAVAPPKDKPTD
ncbi:MAG: ATP-grasp domain-containing protein [bacterium]|nr:ATP-grasp domain-containing protein [bacterium]